MEDNSESMEGQDLAKEQKNELEIQVQKEITKLKTGERTTSIEGLELVKYSNKQAGLSLNGIPIALIQDGKFEYSANGLKQAKAMLQKQGLDFEKIGLPQLEEKLMEKEEEEKQRKQEQSQREEEKNEETNKDDNEKKPEKEDDKKEENETTRGSSWIEIRSDREIDEMRTFIGAIKKEHPEISNIHRTFIAPDKNNSNSYRLYVQGDHGKYNEVQLERTKGVNPMHEQVTRIQNDGTNSTKKTPVEILKINNRSMIMIFEGGRTNTEVDTGVGTDGDKHKSTMISSSRSQNNLNDPNQDVKEQVTSSRYAQVEGDRQERAYAVMINLEKQDVPSEIDPSKDGKGIEAKEMEDFPTALVNNLKDGLKEMLYERNINLSDEAIDKIAESIVDGKDFRDAIEDGTRVDEKAGRIQPDSAERKADDIYNSVTKDEDMEPERDDDEGPNRRRGY